MAFNSSSILSTMTMHPLAFFSTDGGKFQARTVDPHYPPDQILRSDREADKIKYIRRLRDKWPTECQSIFAKSSQGHEQWHLHWFFDEYDYHVMGGSFLYDVILTMQKENEQAVRRFVQAWIACNESNYNNLIQDVDTLTVDDTFNDTDRINGREFLETSLRLIKSKYRAALREHNEQMLHEMNRMRAIGQAKTSGNMQELARLGVPFPSYQPQSIAYHMNNAYSQLPNHGSLGNRSADEDTFNPGKGNQRNRQDSLNSNRKSSEMSEYNPSPSFRGGKTRAGSIAGGRPDPPPASGNDKLPKHVRDAYDVCDVVEMDHRLPNRMTIMANTIGEGIEYLREIYINNVPLKQVGQDDLLRVLTQLVKVECVSVTPRKTFNGVNNDRGNGFATLKSIDDVRKLVWTGFIECKGFKLPVATPMKFWRTGLEENYEVPQTHHSANSAAPSQAEQLARRRRSSSASSHDNQSYVKQPRALYSPQDARLSVPLSETGAPAMEQAMPTPKTDNKQTIRTSPKKPIKAAKMESIVEEHEHRPTSRTEAETPVTPIAQTILPADATLHEASAAKMLPRLNVVTQAMGPSEDCLVASGIANRSDVPATAVKHAAVDLEQSRSEADIPNTAAHALHEELPTDGIPLGLRLSNETADQSSMNATLPAVVMRTDADTTKKHNKKKCRTIGKTSKAHKKKKQSISEASSSDPPNIDPNLVKEPGAPASTDVDGNTTTVTATPMTKIPAMDHGAGPVVPIKEAPIQALNTGLGLGGPAAKPVLMMPPQGVDDAPSTVDTEISKDTTLSPLAALFHPPKDDITRQQASIGGIASQNTGVPEVDFRADSLFGLGVDLGSAIDVDFPTTVTEPSSPASASDPAVSLFQSAVTSQQSFTPLTVPTTPLERPRSSQGAIDLGEWTKEYQRTLAMIRQLSPKEQAVHHPKLESIRAELTSLEEKYDESVEKTTGGKKSARRNGMRHIQKYRESHKDAVLKLYNLYTVVETVLASERKTEQEERRVAYKYPGHNTKEAVTFSEKQGKVAQWPTSTTRLSARALSFNSQLSEVDNVRPYTATLGSIDDIPSFVTLLARAQRENGTSFDTVSNLAEGLKASDYAINEDTMPGSNERVLSNEGADSSKGETIKKSYASVAKAKMAPALPQSPVKSKNAKKKQIERETDSAEWRVDAGEDWRKSGGFKKAA